MISINIINGIYTGFCGYSTIELIKILLHLKINNLGNRKDYLYISGFTSVFLYGTIIGISNIFREYRKLSIA